VQHAYLQKKRRELQKLLVQLHRAMSLFSVEVDAAYLEVEHEQIGDCSRFVVQAAWQRKKTC